MDDGTTHTGIAMRRGGNSEAYLGIDGKEFRIDKRKIKAKQELHTSLMPPGLVYTMSLGELRDLLAFLLQQR
jgi:putative heme-binding domain-containing protein